MMYEPNDDLDCPNCGGKLEEVEGVFMNDIGEGEFCGYACKECQWNSTEV